MVIGGSHIAIKPYECIEDVHFGRCKIIIRQQDFHNISFVKGRATFLLLTVHLMALR